MTGNTLEEWVAELAREFGLDVPLDVKALLDAARDAAHEVARPAAPLTTYVVGFVAARTGGDLDAVRRAAATASRLAVARGASNAE